MLWLVGSNPVRRQKEAPARADADRVLDAYVANFVKTYDANDVLYALESSADDAPVSPWKRSLRRCWRSTPLTI